MGDRQCRRVVAVKVAEAAAGAARRDPLAGGDGDPREEAGRQAGWLNETITIMSARSPPTLRVNDPLESESRDRKKKKQKRYDTYKYIIVAAQEKGKTNP